MLKRALCWVADRELLFVAALGPLFLLPGLYTPLALALIALLWLIRWAARGRIVPRLPAVNAAMLALLVMLPVSLWASVDLSLSWPRLYQIVYGVALFYALVGTVKNERQAAWLVGGLFTVVVAFSLLGLVGTEWARAKLFALPVYRALPAVITDQSSVPGGSFHPNVIAGTLAPFVPFALALLVARYPGRRFFQVVEKIALALVSLLLVFTVLLTQSRGGWLALAAGLLALIVALHRRLGWALLGLAVIVAVVALAFSGLSLQELFLQLDTTGSGTSRLEVWSRALAMLRDMPFTGIGLGTFPVILDAFYPSFLAGPEARIPHAHNLLLQVGVDLGVPGMLALALLFIASALAALSALRRAERRSFAWGLSAGVFTALVVVAVHGLFDAPLWTARSSPLLWLLLACGLSVRAMAAEHPVAVDGAWRLLTAAVGGDWAAFDGAVDWEALLALAKRLELTPLLYRLLRAAHRSLPPDVEACLMQAYWTARLHNEVRARALAEIACVLAAHDIPVLLLKGLALVGLAYPDLGARPMGDIDLLVRQEDVERASVLLEGLGYAPLEGQQAGRPADFMTHYDGERAFSGAAGMVELHWCLINYDWFRDASALSLQDLWQRAGPMDESGVLRFSPEDTLLYLCLHLGVHHAYAVARMLVDIDQLVRHQQGLDWGAIVERARLFRLRNALYFGLEMAQRLLGTPLPPGILSQLCPPGWICWAVERLVNPLARLPHGEEGLGPQSLRFLHFLLVDRWQDRWRGIGRLFFPGRDWIAARYAADTVQKKLLYGIIHPVRMIGLLMLGLRQLTGR